LILDENSRIFCLVGGKQSIILIRIIILKYGYQKMFLV